MKKIFHYLKIIPEFFLYIDTFFVVPKSSFTNNKNPFLLWQGIIVAGICCIFFYCCYQTHNELFYIIEENNIDKDSKDKVAFYFSSIKTLITTGITLFGTLLALYWASIIGALSIQYASITHAIKEFFFKLLKSKQTTLLTSCYLISNFFLYIAIDHKIIDSKYISHVFYSWLIITASLTSLYSWLSVEIFKYIDSYQLYHKLSQKIYINFYRIRYWHKKTFFKPSLEQLSKQLILQKEIISHLIYKELLNPNETPKFLGDNLILLKLYWENKKTIYYNCDWYPPTEKYNSDIEIVLTANINTRTRDIELIENSFIVINNMLTDYLFNQNQFYILLKYYEELKILLDINQKENLNSYELPNFSNILTILSDHINRYLFIDRYHKLIEQNKDNLNFYKMFAEIEFTLTNLVTTAQTYLFKFNEKTINNFIPSYKDLLNITTTQDLFTKFPLINNENGLSLYSQIFLEKQLENNVISSKEKIYNNTKAIITTELYKIYKILNSTAVLLKYNLKFFKTNKINYLLGNSLFVFLIIKYSFLKNKAYYEESLKNQPELLKQYNELFVLPTDFPELIIEVITTYTTNQYAFEFFPNLLYHIYLHLLVIFMEAIKLDYFELPIIITSFFKLSFIKQQDIANTNNNNLKEYYQANYIILSQTSSILGCYLILSDNNYQYIKKEQLTELINSLITVEQYKPAFQNMKNQLDDLIELLKTPNLFPDVVTIEKELSTTDIKITNSVKVFADFLNNMIKEN